MASIMAQNTDGEAAARIDQALEKAQELTEAGQLQEAHSALREANHQDPTNPRIKRAFEDLQDAEDGRPVVNLAERWLHSKSDDDGEILLDYLHKHPLSDRWSSAAMEVMMRYRGDKNMVDQLTSELLKGLGAQRYLADQMKAAPTATYSRVFEWGNDSINALDSILLDPKPWSSEEDRIAAERDVFQLALAQMMKAGEDDPERAMCSISRMLDREAKNLKGLIDADGFDIILTQLDDRLPEALRRHATIATSKLFELSPDNSEALIAQFVVTRIKKPTADSLIISFSAATAVFPMAPSAAEKLFLSEGFLPNLSKLVTKWKSTRLEHAALNLLDVACMSPACRDGMRKSCREWIEEMSETFKAPKKSLQARKILMKLKADSKDGTGEQKSGGPGTASPSSSSSSSTDTLNWDQQASSFSSLIIDMQRKRGTKQPEKSSPSSGKTPQDSELRDALEGLGLCTLKSPQARDKCGRNLPLLHAVAEAIDVETFAGLQVLAHITKYPPRLSEEQKTMQKLQGYAANTKSDTVSPLDSESKIDIRCRNVLTAQVVSHIAQSVSQATHLSAVVAVEVMNNLAVHKSNRGQLAQQGAIRILTKLWDAARLYTYPEETAKAQRYAAHAVARILISTNPNVYFRGESRKEQSLPICSKMLQQLIADDPTAQDGPRDWLPVFEALLAMTNLATIEDERFQEQIAAQNVTRIEDLLLGPNHQVRARATELLSNLSCTPTVLKSFAHGSSGAKKRMEILLALTTAAEKETRLAALGALCMMTEALQPVALTFVQEGRSITAAARILNPPEEDLELEPPLGEDEQYRMCYIIRTLAAYATDENKKWLARLLAVEGVQEAGKAAMAATRNPELREMLAMYICIGMK